MATCVSFSFFVVVAAACYCAAAANNDEVIKGVLVTATMSASALSF